MNKNNVLFILDWDDTLFPTTWILQNNINISEINDLNPYIVHFSELDETLYKLFYKLLMIGKVIIITNATLGWITTSLKILPKTFGIIRKNVNIISARDKYQRTSNMPVWKSNVFMYDILPLSRNAKHIISIGDADYEYNALTNLTNSTYYKNKYLKSLRLVQLPSFDILVEQISIMINTIGLICDQNKHLDLLFNKNK